MYKKLRSLTGRAQHTKVSSPITVIDVVHYICCIFNIQTIKPFIVSEITSKGHSRSSAMPPFVILSGLNQRPEMRATRIFREKTTTKIILKVDQGYRRRTSE